ncbi:hypothetical protein BJI48_00075 [Helicobacter sp. 11S02596-1]|nr:hypothetical protein BJI48_00075 [Helicobacter sp. 11S02596-1]
MHFRGKKSEITDKKFFYSPAGNRDPKAELEATIREFYRPIEAVKVPSYLKEIVANAKKIQGEHRTKIPQRSANKADYHAICRFGARFDYLDGALHFEGLPKNPCKEFTDMFAYIDPKSASIVFPSSFMGSPASMFGHTFLLLNSSFDSKLLAHAVDFAAQVDISKENPLVYMTKGLLGGYDGFYAIAPYYDKLKEYSDTENRDIYEFGLNLSEEEVKKMYRHIWELRDIGIEYFYFDKNCSYNMLWLLEIAREGVDLHQYFIYQVNPPETIFAMNNEGLIAGQEYRPSKWSKITAYEKKLRHHALFEVKKISQGVKEPQSIFSEDMPHKEKQAVLEASAEMAEYRYIKNKMPLPEYLKTAHQIALARSFLGKGEALVFDPDTFLQGNQGTRMMPYAFIKNGKFASGFEFRLAYHDITDNDVGYLKGMQIEFLKGSFYLDGTQSSVFQLQEAKIFSVASYGMMSYLFHPITYRFNTGFDRSFWEDRPVYYAALGGGASYAVNDYLYMYYVLEPIFYVLRSSRVALGNSLGMVASNARLKLTIEYSNRVYGRIIGHILDASFSVQIVHNLALFVNNQSYFFNDRATRQQNAMGLRIYF